MTCDVNDGAHNIAIGHKIIYNTKFSSPSAAAHVELRYNNRACNVNDLYFVIIPLAPNGCVRISCN